MARLKRLLRVTGPSLAVLATTGCASHRPAPATRPATALSEARLSSPLPTELPTELPTGPPSASANTDPVVAWLDRTLVPLTARVNAPVDDIAPIGRWFADKRVVAMGEATHGTKEFFDLKARFFRYLVTEHGFRTLAMEMRRAESEAVDTYLKTGAGDPRELVRGSYFFFDAMEIVELIEWMRSYNERVTTAKQLSFFGFDVPGTPAADKIDASCGDRRGCRVVLRDGFMAHHIKERMAQTDGGFFVWAHNGHIADFEKADGWKPMGHYLRKHLGVAYYAIAFEFYRGGFIAPGGGALPTRRSRTLAHLNGRVVSEYLLPPAPRGSVAHRFAQARAHTYFVSLADPPSPARAFFADHLRLHTYGSAPPSPERSYEAYAPLHTIFDAMIFVHTTNGYTFTPIEPAATGP